jgi:hypothetical protein
LHIDVPAFDSILKLVQHKDKLSRGK